MSSLDLCRAQSDPLRVTHTDAQMKVSSEILQRVYEAFQSGGDNGGAEDEILDPDRQIHFINAYDMPLWNWSTERATFERYVSGLICERYVPYESQCPRSAYNIRNGGFAGTCNS